MTDARPTRWQELTGGRSAAGYTAHFDRLAAAGRDVHGEATFCASLLPPGARVLDAGCGTGRVAARLAELGYSCTGVDADESMLASARTKAPRISWVLADIAGLDATDLGDDVDFDMVVLAGNVIPLLAPGTLQSAVDSLTGLLAPGGLLVAGFGLDAAHLPPGCPVTTLEDYDDACDSAGVTGVNRFSTWQGSPFDETAGYAVSVHRR